MLPTGKGQEPNVIEMHGGPGRDSNQVRLLSQGQTKTEIIGLRGFEPCEESAPRFENCLDAARRELRFHTRRSSRRLKIGQTAQRSYICFG